MERQLAQRGMDPNAFLQMQGKTREELIEESKPDAERELKREAVVTAIAEAEEIEVSDEELVEALAHSAEHERTTPEKLLARLRENGRDAMVAKTSGPARRSSWWPRRRSRSRSSRPRRASRSGRRRRSAEEAGDLWTPDESLSLNRGRMGVRGRVSVPLRGELVAPRPRGASLRMLERDLKGRADSQIAFPRASRTFPGRGTDSSSTPPGISVSLRS